MEAAGRHAPSTDLSGKTRRKEEHAFLHSVNHEVNMQRLAKYLHLDKQPSSKGHTIVQHEVAAATRSPESKLHLGTALSRAISKSNDAISQRAKAQVAHATAIHAKGDAKVHHLQKAAQKAPASAEVPKQTENQSLKHVSKEAEGHISRKEEAKPAQAIVDKAASHASVPEKSQSPVISTMADKHLQTKTSANEVLEKEEQKTLGQNTRLVRAIKDKQDVRETNMKAVHDLANKKVLNLHHKIQQVEEACVFVCV